MMKLRGLRRVAIDMRSHLGIRKVEAPDHLCGPQFGVILERLDMGPDRIPDVILQFVHRHLGQGFQACITVTQIQTVDHVQ